LFNFADNSRHRRVSIEEAYGLISNLEANLLEALETAQPEEIEQIQCDLNKVAYQRAKLSQEENS